MRLMQIACAWLFASRPLPSGWPVYGFDHGLGKSLHSYARFPSLLRRPFLGLRDTRLPTGHVFRSFALVHYTRRSSRAECLQGLSVSSRFGIASAQIVTLLAGVSSPLKRAASESHIATGMEILTKGGRGGAWDGWCSWPQGWVGVRGITGVIRTGVAGAGAAAVCRCGELWLRGSCPLGGEHEWSHEANRLGVLYCVYAVSG